MPEQPLKPMVVHAIIDNAYDSVIRFLADAQRMGLILDQLQVVSAAESKATLNAVMSVPVGMDIEHLAVRFARHPSVRSVSCAHLRKASEPMRRNVSQPSVCWFRPICEPAGSGRHWKARTVSRSG
jgi:hypothetical protein